MENQPRCLNDQKTKKIIDAIDAMDDEKGIKEYAYDEGENGKKTREKSQNIYLSNLWEDIQRSINIT